MKKLESATPILKLNNTLRWVLRIIAGLGYIVFITGILQSFSAVIWMSSGIVVFLCMAIFCSIIAVNESRLFEYAVNVPITSLPKPAHDPKFWERRKISLLSLLGSFFLLGLGYVASMYVFILAIIFVGISFLLLVYHILLHPKKGTHFRVSNTK